MNKIGLSARYPEWLPYHSHEWCHERAMESVKRCVAQGRSKPSREKVWCQFCGYGWELHAKK